MVPSGSTRTFRHLAMSLAVAGASGCSLGLDPTLMDRQAQKGTGDGGTPGMDPGSTDASAAAGEDSGAASGSPAVPGDGTQCTTDADCTSAFAGNACVSVAHCDPTWHVCSLDVCDVGACNIADCNLLTKQCGQPSSMDFTISVFSVVSGGVGGVDPKVAVAAAYPFLFVITTNGVVAYNVANPTMTAPAMVAVNGLSFIPDAVVSSGRRVYFVSSVQGEGPAYRQAIAWVDVPGNPFLTSLTASSSFIWTTQPTMAGAFADPSGGLDLVYDATYDPTAALTPPIASSEMSVPAPIASLSQEASIVTSSGAQLVAYRYGYGNHQPVFSLVSGVSQNSGQATAEHTISSFGAVDDQSTFAIGDDGAVLWESAPLHHGDAGVDGVNSARLTWLVPTTDGGLFDTSAHADLETYSGNAAAIAYDDTGSASPIVGPAVLANPTTAVALAATVEDPTESSVQVFDRTSGSIVGGRRAVIPAPPWTLGVAASNGFAYVLAPSDYNNESAKVYVVAPGCTTGATDTDDGGASSEGGTGSPDGGDHGHPGFTVLAE